MSIELKPRVKIPSFTVTVKTPEGGIISYDANSLNVCFIEGSGGAGLSFLCSGIVKVFPCEQIEAVKYHAPNPELFDSGCPFCHSRIPFLER